MRTLLHSNTSSSSSFFDALDEEPNSEGTEPDSEVDEPNKHDSEEDQLDSEAASEAGSKQSSEEADCVDFPESDFDWESPDEALQEKRDPSFVCSKPRRSKRIERRNSHN